MTDIGYESRCPKCGYCPKDTMSDDKRQFINYIKNPHTFDMPHHESILLVCMKCSYTWAEPCQDRGQPKVLGAGGEEE